MLKKKTKNLICLLACLASFMLFSTTAFAEGSIDRTKGEAGIGQGLSTPLETLSESVRYDFTNTRTTTDESNAGKELAITKKLAGEGITASDRQKAFTFNVHITNLENDKTYIVIGPQDDENDPPQSAYRTPTNGTLDITETLKEGEWLYIKDLPANQARYTITERMNSADPDFGYDARYEVTLGEDTVTSQGGFAANTAQNLSTPQESLQRLNVQYTFTNSKSSPHDLKFVKEVKVDGVKKTEERSFPVTISFSGMDPNTTYTSKSGSVSFTTDGAGKAVLNTNLSTAGALEFENVPGTTIYNVVEENVSYLPSIKVTDTSNDTQIAAATGSWGDGIEYESSEEGLSEDQTITLTNSENTSNDLTIKKLVDGSGASTADTFAITARFKGLAKNRTYTVNALGGSPATLTSDASGEATVTLTVSDEVEYVFKDIPNTAKFTLSEAASPGYVPAFNVETAGGIDALSRTGEEGQALELPAWESLVADTEYTFLNTKELPGPEKTVSDFDSVKLSGTGAETDVTENTVENRAAVWEYKITQDVPAGSSSFTLTDILPAYIITDLDTDPDINSVHAKLIRNDGQDIIEGDYTESDGVYSNDAFDITFDDSDINATLTASLKNTMLAQGGTVELTFTAYLPADVELEELSNAGCVKAGGKRLLFNNTAKTQIGDWKFNTDTVKTNVLMDNGLTIKKNVTDELGDKTKAFDFNIALSGLDPNTMYSYTTPQSITVSAEYNNGAVFSAVDAEGNPVKNVPLKIYELTDMDGEEYVGEAKTGANGTVTVSLPEGDYIVRIYSTECPMSYAADGFEFEETAVISAADKNYFKPGNDGTASIDFTLIHDQSITFDDLPSGAAYNITEAASEYKASYIVTRGADYVDTQAKINSEYNTQLKSGGNLIHADKDVTFVFNNAPPTETIRFSKQSMISQSELPGAYMRLTDANGNDIEDWVSTTTPHEIELVANKEYVLIEDDSPAGYEVSDSIRFRLAFDRYGDIIVEVKDGNVWVPTTGTTVTMVDETSTYPVTFEKKDRATGDLLSGAQLQLKDAANNTIKSWTTSTGTVSEDLHPGVYTLTEVAPPRGYSQASPISFIVNENGTISSTTEGAITGNKVTMFDDTLNGTVRISKKSIVNQSELPGAEMTITDIGGSEIESWTSTSTPHETMLPINQEFILTEDDAPAGYATADSIHFRLVLDNSDNIIVQVKNGNTWETAANSTVTMIDELTPYAINIEKRDYRDHSHAVTGASMRLKNSLGQTIASWTSNGSAHVENLTAGIYTLEEVSPPGSYLPADPISFTVNTNGTVTSTTSGAVSGRTVTMYDKPLPDTKNQIIRKVWVDDDDSRNMRPNVTYFRLYKIVNSQRVYAQLYESGYSETYDYEYAGDYTEGDNWYVITNDNEVANTSYWEITVSGLPYEDANYDPITWYIEERTVTNNLHPDSESNAVRWAVTADSATSTETTEDFLEYSMTQDDVEDHYYLMGTVDDSVTGSDPDPLIMTNKLPPQATFVVDIGKTLTSNGYIPNSISRTFDFHVQEIAGSGRQYIDTRFGRLSKGSFLGLSGEDADAPFDEGPELIALNQGEGYKEGLQREEAESTHGDFSITAGQMVRLTAEEGIIDSTRMQDYTGGKCLYAYLIVEENPDSSNMHKDSSEWVLIVQRNTDGYYQVYYFDLNDINHMPDENSFSIGNGMYEIGNDGVSYDNDPLTLADVPITFANTYTPGSYNVTAEKTVSGNSPDANKMFTFTASFENLQPGTSYTASYSRGSRNGTAAASMTSNASGTATATFTMKHGESVTFEGLPEGTTYYFSEDPDGFNGRVATANHNYLLDANGAPVNATVNDLKETIDSYSGDQTVSFTNSKSVMIPTGVAKKVIPIGAVLAGVAILLLVMYLNRRKIRARKSALDN